MIATQPRLQSLLADSLHRLDHEATHGVLDMDRYRCKYVSWGDGPPIIFIHGLGDSLHSFTLPMSLLSDQFQCIAYNQPTGVGDGAKLKAYGHSDLVTDLFQLMDHSDLKEAILFGFSFGSTIALRAMHDRPERVCRGIIQGGFAHRPLHVGEKRLAWLGRLLPLSIRWLPFRRTVMHQFHQFAFRDADADVWPFFIEQTSRCAMKTMAHWALVLDQTDVRSILSNVRQPVLQICGDRDYLVPHHCQDLLFNQLPNSAMFQIDECGHFPIFSHPHAIASAVRQFLTTPMCQEGVAGICSAQDECALHTACQARR